MFLCFLATCEFLFHQNWCEIDVRKGKRSVFFIFFNIHHSTLGATACGYARDLLNVAILCKNIVCACSGRGSVPETVKVPKSTCEFLLWDFVQRKHLGSFHDRWDTLVPSMGANLA